MNATALRLGTAEAEQVLQRCPPWRPVRILSMIKVLVLCGRPMRRSPRAAEAWLREEVGNLLTDGAAYAGLLGDFRLSGMRPSLVVAGDQRSVVPAERHA